SSGVSTRASEASVARRGDASVASRTASYVARTSAARTARPSAKRTSSRRRKTSVRSPRHFQARASSGTRPARGSARVSATCSRSATRALVASTPKRGSRLCGSLSSAITRPAGTSCRRAQALAPRTQAVLSQTTQAIWLTLFRTLWYDPARRRGRGEAEVSMRVSGLLATFFLLLTAPVGADTFPRPASLEPQIRFWRDVFGAYSHHQVVLHDT